MREGRRECEVQRSAIQSGTPVPHVTVRHLETTDTAVAVHPPPGRTRGVEAVVTLGLVRQDRKLPNPTLLKLTDHLKLTVRQTPKEPSPYPFLLLPVYLHSR